MRIVSIILFVTAALALLACSSEPTPTATVPEQSQPTPDVDATVEAGIAGTREAEATPALTPIPKPTPTATSAPAPTVVPDHETIDKIEFLRDANNFVSVEVRSASQGIFFHRSPDSGQWSVADTNLAVEDKLALEKLSVILQNLVSTLDLGWSEGSYDPSFYGLDQPMAVIELKKPSGATLMVELGRQASERDLQRGLPVMADGRLPHYGRFGPGGKLLTLSNSWVEQVIDILSPAHPGHLEREVLGGVVKVI